MKDLELEIVLRGQAYALVGTEPREGDKPSLLLWATHCAACGEPMRVKSGRLIKYLTRRCPLHKAPGQKVKSQ